MLRSLQKLRALPASDRRLLLNAGLLLVVVKIALPIAGLPALRWLLGTLIARVAQCRFFTPGPDAARIGWAVSALARRGGVTCLGQALVTQTLLELRGSRATMWIGVRRTAAGGFESHAWIESVDGPLPGQPAPGTFSPLLAFPRMRP